MSLEIERLTADDVDDAHTLSTQAGWNQTRADWRRLVELFPETCFAGRVEGDVVATSTLVAYDATVGWIGMVLVDEGHRRRGYGSEIFERALRAGRNRGIDVIGLDATDAGRTVYEQYDFETVVGIDRWSGAVQSSVDACGVAAIERPGKGALVDAMASFDARRVSVDRRPLLTQLLESPRTTGLVVENDDGDVRGYAVVRPGRTKPQVGPLVAASDVDAERLLAAAGERVGGPLVVDGLRSSRTESLLERVGLDVMRRLYRMTHEEPNPALVADDIVAAAGFEWG
jgi:GNAT superfamily N-acetyltransferase